MEVAGQWSPSWRWLVSGHHHHGGGWSLSGRWLVIIIEVVAFNCVGGILYQGGG